MNCNLVINAFPNQVEPDVAAADRSVFEERQAPVARPGPRNTIAFHFQTQSGLAREAVLGGISHPPGPAGAGGVRHQACEPQRENGGSYHWNSRTVLDRTVTYTCSPSRRKYSWSQRSVTLVCSGSFLPFDRIAAPAGETK